MFLDFFQIQNCTFDTGFLNFWQKIFSARNLKKCWVHFHKICTAGTSALLDVQCKFMLKSDRKLLRYSHLKIIVQVCPG